uniref:Uncharacterized protein n=2 Tax=Meloidogyne TaxID=189290 RepID=A0A6V7Y143_MELEN|nr:unnamed protein product [Meloidogyne enterolobii]
MELDLDSRSSIEVSSLCFKDALHLAVGLSNGYVRIICICNIQFRTPLLPLHK